MPLGSSSGNSIVYPGDNISKYPRNSTKYLFNELGTSLHNSIGFNLTRDFGFGDFEQTLSLANLFQKITESGVFFI
jgi:hypothetical protein